MFSNSIDSKVNKIKLNVQGYLNDRKKQSAVSQPVPSVRRPDQTASLPVPSLTAQNSTTSNPMQGPVSGSQFKPMDMQVRQLTFQGKVYDKPPLSIKNIIKEKSITVLYTEDQTRFKLEVKAVDNSLDMRINQQKSSIELSFKKAVKYKFFKQESGEPKWILISEIKDDKVFIIANKDGKTLRNYFEGIVPEECIKLESGEVKMQDKSVAGEAMEKEEVQDADDVVNFLMPTAQQLADTQKFRKAIKDMKEEEKIMILMDIFKIKKEYDENVALDRKKLKCPIFACQKTYREISQLKTHLKKHPELNKHGIEFTEFGTFQYGNKAMDLALYLGKLYPFELKKIIKKMKTKQVAE